jgi:arylsulfatase A-like enzyme
MLLAKLKELGLYENTVVVLVGDHGFHTGELGLWCKSTNYEAACHSPLIIRSPRNEHVHVKNPVELIDIYPTLAALCDVKVPDSLSGKDLAEISEGDRTYAFSQFPRPYAALHNASKRTHMGYAVRDDRWRYVEWYDNDGNMAARELYDLGSDLLETENLADSNEHVDVMAHFSDMLRSCRQ